MFLTDEIAVEYRRKAQNISNHQYIGELRRLGKELQERCGVTELEAINILNGNHINEYVHKYERKRSKIYVDIDLHQRNISYLQQEEEAADRRAMEDDGW